MIPATATVDPSSGHGYEVVAVGSSWTDASAAARAKGGYLARINSNAEQAFVASLLASAPGGQYWVGGVHAPVAGCSWSWTDGTGINTAESPCAASTSSQWFGANPKVGPEFGGPNFMALINIPGLPVGGWNTEYNYQGFYSIVEYDAAAPASVKVTDPASGQSYEFYYTPVTFEEASAIAVAKGGYLTRIGSALEQSFIASQLVSQPRVQFWTGGQHVANATCAWTWENGAGIPTPGSSCAGFSNWFGGSGSIPADPSYDPDYTGTRNFYLTLLNQDYFYALNAGATWNDLPSDAPMLVDAVIEYDAPVAPPPVVNKYSALCTLTWQYVTQHGIANSLCVKLNAAAASDARGNVKAKQNQLDAYMKEVKAQTGKWISASNVSALLAIASQL